MPLRQGESLGRYVIDGVIGHGGMGSVYRAHDTRLQRAVALKVLAAEGGASLGLSTTGGSARILREARLAAKLEHPNIVSIYDVDEIPHGEHAGLAYIAMELVLGRSLREYIGDGSVAMATRIRWLTEVARGLSAAHDRGLVHRDVKPENVMVGVDGVAKVLDFGVARQLAGRTLSPQAASITPGRAGVETPPSPSDASVVVQTGAEPYATTVTGEGLVLGTPYYMSPEQMKGERVDARSDQFSWGVVAYELLTGTAPWGSGVAPVHVVAAILGNEPVAPDVLDPDVPARLSAVVTRAMAKRVDRRFASVHELIAALDAHDDSRGKKPKSARSVQQIVSARLPPRPAAGGRSMLWGLGVGAMAIAAATITLRFTLRGSAASIPSTPASIDATPGCTSSVVCTRSQGAPALCVESRCVPVASTDCHPSADATALGSDATLWLGAMYPMTGRDAEVGAVYDRGTDLGRQDFSESGAALNASGTRVRSIAIVSCDESADPGRAARHLVEDLRLPAVLGFASGDTMVQLATTVFVPHHVLALSTLTTDSLTTRIPHPKGAPPLVWRGGFGLTEGARAIAAFVAESLDPQLRAEGVKRTRVALVRTKSAESLAFSEDLFGALRFNGRSALENGDDFQEIIVNGAATAPARELEVAVARLRQLEPGIVLYARDPAVIPVLESFENGHRERPRRKTRYVSNASIDRAIVTMMGTDLEVRGRIFGVTRPWNTSSNARFTLHYNGVYGTNLSRDDAPSTAYDGFYLLAYATMALGDRPVTGPNLAAAMAKLVPPGAPIEVGPGDIFEAFTKLRAGESIDLEGTGGPLDLDLQTGENSTDLAIECLAADKNGVATGGVESGLIYSAKTGTLTGKMHCP